MKTNIINSICLFLEIACVVVLVWYLLINVETTSSMTADLLKLAFWTLLAVTLPVYIIGLIHLILIKRTREFLPAFGYSAAGFGGLYFLGLAIPIVLPVAALAPYIIFNSVALWDYDFKPSQP